MTRAAVSHLKRQDQGRILNVAGTPRVVHPLLALAPSITVNCVAPDLMEGTRMFARVPPARVAAVKEQTALKRTANPEDVEGDPTPLGRLLQLPRSCVSSNLLPITYSLQFSAVLSRSKLAACSCRRTGKHRLCLAACAGRLRLAKRWHPLERPG